MNHNLEHLLYVYRIIQINFGHDELITVKVEHAQHIIYFVGLFNLATLKYVNPLSQLLSSPVNHIKPIHTHSYCCA